MADNNQQFHCSGNCLQCSPAQRAYCASQHAYSNMKVLDKMVTMLDKMQADMDTLQNSVQEIAAKVEAIQNSEATVFDPCCDPEPYPKEFAKKESEKK